MNDKQKLGKFIETYETIKSSLDIGYNSIITNYFNTVSYCLPYDKELVDTIINDYALLKAKVDKVFLPTIETFATKK